MFGHITKTRLNQTFKILRLGLVTLDPQELFSLLRFANEKDNWICIHIREWRCFGSKSNYRIQSEIRSNPVPQIIGELALTCVSRHNESQPPAFTKQIQRLN